MYLHKLLRYFHDIKPRKPVRIIYILYVLLDSLRNRDHNYNPSSAYKAWCGDDDWDDEVEDDEGNAACSYDVCDTPAF